MSAFSVSIRLNLRTAAAGDVIDVLAPVLREAGLDFHNDAPGLVQGEDVPAGQLAMLLDRLASMAMADEAGLTLLASGAVDDLWLHIRRTR